jgi:hypothetical protein
MNTWGGALKMIQFWRRVFPARSGGGKKNADAAGASAFEGMPEYCRTIRARERARGGAGYRRGGARWIRSRGRAAGRSRRRP